MMPACAQERAFCGCVQLRGWGWGRQGTNAEEVLARSNGRVSRAEEAGRRAAALEPD